MLLQEGFSRILEVINQDSCVDHLMWQEIGQVNNHQDIDFLMVRLL